jgi:hypothetical protein
MFKYGLTGMYRTVLIKMFTRNLEPFQMSANNSDCFNLKSHYTNYEKK